MSVTLRPAYYGNARTPATSSSFSSSTAQRKDQSYPQTFPKTFFSYIKASEMTISRERSMQNLFCFGQIHDPAQSRSQMRTRFKVAAKYQSLKKQSFVTHDGNGVVTLRPFFNTLRFLNSYVILKRLYHKNATIIKYEKSIHKIKIYFLRRVTITRRQKSHIHTSLV